MLPLYAIASIVYVARKSDIYGDEVTYMAMGWHILRWSGIYKDGVTYMKMEWDISHTSHSSVWKISAVIVATTLNLSDNLSYVKLFNWIFYVCVEVFAYFSVTFDI